MNSMDKYPNGNEFGEKISLPKIQNQFNCICSLKNTIGIIVHIRKQIVYYFDIEVVFIKHILWTKLQNNINQNDLFYVKVKNLIRHVSRTFIYVFYR